MRPAGLAHTVIVVQSTSKKETANPQLSAVGTQAHLDDLLRRARAGRCGRRTRRQKVRRPSDPSESRCQPRPRLSRLVSGLVPAEGEGHASRADAGKHEPWLC